MNEEGKAEAINTVLQVLGILGIFFAGYFLETWFALALFLFVCGVAILQVRYVLDEEEDKTEKKGMIVDSSLTFEEAHKKAVDEVTRE